jgi:hypothetical protein
MKTWKLILTGAVFIVSGCSPEIIPFDVAKIFPVASPGQELRLESNQPGTAFCLGGEPLLSNDSRVSVDSGDRIYTVNLQLTEPITVVAAKDGYYPFIDSVAPEKRRLKFDFFSRNKCGSSSGGRTCVTTAMISDLNSFRKLCKQHP